MSCAGSIVPTKRVEAYTSPYYIKRVQSQPFSFQSAQIVRKNGVTYVLDYLPGRLVKVVNGVSYNLILPSTGTSSPDGGLAINSTLDSPVSFDVADNGTIYIAEGDRHKVRVILPNGILSTVAGNGQVVPYPQSREDGPDATQLAFNNPSYVKIGPDGSLYVFDDNVVRRIKADGSTDHVAGHYSANPNFNPYVDGGVAIDHPLPSRDRHAYYFWKSGSLLAFSPEGKLFITAGNSILRLDFDGTIHTVYKEPANATMVYEDQPLSEALIPGIFGFDFDSAGNLWTTGGPVIKYISPDGIVHTAAGGGQTRAPALGSDLYLYGTAMGLSIENDEVYFLAQENGGQSAHFIGKAYKRTDLSPPVVSYQLSPPATQYGWNNSATQLTWYMSDPDSSITEQDGCETTTVNPGQAASDGINFTCTVGSNGGVTSLTVRVMIDTQAPVLTYEYFPQRNAEGWNNTDVNVIPDCNDVGTSQLESCPTQMEFTTETAGTVITRTIQDLAGNSTTQSTTVKIDKTAPSGAFTGSNLVIRTLLGQTITGTAGDGLSGVKNVSISGAGYILSSEYGGLNLSCNSPKTSCTWSALIQDLPSGANNYTLTVTDVAGNVYTSIKQYIIL